MSVTITKAERHDVESALALAEDHLGVDTIVTDGYSSATETRGACSCCSVVYTIAYPDGHRLSQVVVHIDEDADVDEGRWRNRNTAKRIEVQS